MICEHCGDRNRTVRRFCASCGTALLLSCPGCGFENASNARFCGGCGLQVTAFHASPFEEGLRSPTNVLGPAGRAAPHRAQGERKCVTVLFADIKGSLALIEEIDSEAACIVLDGTIEIMIASVRRYGGTVNRILGDGIMAVFGAPVAQEDHAVQGCHAAFSILGDLKQHIAAVNANYGKELQIRIGLSSGEVTVRTVPSHAAIPYDVIGTTAHLASRMEQLASPNAVWMTEDTAKLVRDFVDLKKVDQVQVKGLSREIEVFELVKVHPRRGPFDVSLAKGLSQFVGRRDELDRLEAALADTALGDGRIVTIVAEAGMGKSRLCHEFTRRAAKNGKTVLRADANTYGEGVPWQRLISLLRLILATESGDKAEKVRRKLRMALGALNIDLGKHEKPLLASLDALSAKDKAWQDLDPRSRQARIDEAFIALFKCLSQERPTVILFEDLHKSDAQTLAVLDALCRQLQGTRILVLINYRPHFQHDWPLKDVVSDIQLSPLNAAHAGELLDAHLGKASDLDKVKDQLIARAEGNPFFLEESLRQLVDVGTLDGPPGELQLATSMPDLVVPPTVHAAIAAQIDHLAFKDKQLLRAAAVIGETFVVSLLREIDESEDNKFDEKLDRLQSLGFIQPLADEVFGVYRFRHALIRDVAYQDIATWQSKLMHRRVVYALDEGDGDSSTELLATLVDHALCGQLWVAAFGYAMDVAKRAMAQSASGDALAACGKAKVALSNINEDKNLDRKRLDLCFTQIEIHFAIGNHVDVSDHIDEAFAIAKDLEDRHPLLRTLSFKALRAWLNGEIDHAVTVAEQARAIAVKINSLDMKINTTIRLGYELIAQGSYCAAVNMLKTALDLIPEDRIGERFDLTTIASVSAQAALARALAELLEFDHAQAAASEAFRLSHEFNHPFTLLFVTQEIGISHLRAKDPLEAIRVLSIGRKIAEEMPPNALRPPTLSELGLAMVETHHFAEGIKLCEEAIDCSRKLKLVPQFGQQLGHLARGYFLSGQLNKAVELADEALALTLRYGERGDEAWIRFLIAEIAAQRNFRKGKELFVETRDLASERGLLTLKLRCEERLSHFRPQHTMEQLQC